MDRRQQTRTGDKEYSRVALGHHGALRRRHDGEQLASDVDNLQPHTRSAFRRCRNPARSPSTRAADTCPPVPSQAQSPTGAAPDGMRCDGEAHLTAGCAFAPCASPSRPHPTDCGLRTGETGKRKAGGTGRRSGGARHRGLYAASAARPLAAALHKQPVHRQLTFSIAFGA